MKPTPIRITIALLAVTAVATVCLAGDKGGMLHPAENEGAVFTVASTFKTQIKFVNDSGKTVKIFWMDQNKTRQLKATLKDGKDEKFDTFITHPWLVTDKDENAIAIYWPDTEPRTVKLK